MVETHLLVSYQKSPVNTPRKTTNLLCFVVIQIILFLLISEVPPHATDYLPNFPQLQIRIGGFYLIPNLVMRTRHGCGVGLGWRGYKWLSLCREVTNQRRPCALNSISKMINPTKSCGQSQLSHGINLASHLPQVKDQRLKHNVCLYSELMKQL